MATSYQIFNMRKLVLSIELKKLDTLDEQEKLIKSKELLKNQIVYMRKLLTTLCKNDKQKCLDHIKDVSEQLAIIEKRLEEIEVENKRDMLEKIKNYTEFYLFENYRQKFVDDDNTYDGKIDNYTERSFLKYLDIKTYNNYQLSIETCNNKALVNDYKSHIKLYFSFERTGFKAITLKKHQYERFVFVPSEFINIIPRSKPFSSKFRKGATVRYEFFQELGNFIPRLYYYQKFYLAMPTRMTNRFKERPESYRSFSIDSDFEQYHEIKEKIQLEKARTQQTKMTLSSFFHNKTIKTLNQYEKILDEKEKEMTKAYDDFFDKLYLGVRY